MDRRQLAEALRPVVSGGGTAYLALADALRGLVLDGRLLVGDTLPAERVLAGDLGASRTTVTTALDLLRGEGLVVSRQGSGTVVAAAPDRVDRPDEVDAHLATLGPHGAIREDDIDLTIAAPSAPSALGPLAQAAAARLPAHLAGHGLHPLGLRDLRQAIAGRYEQRGVPTTADQIVVTQGALHGWDLMLRAYAKPGDPVGLEVPTYAGCADAARAHHVRLTPVGVDGWGWSLPRRTTHPVIAVVTPDHQNPTGAHASDAQRRRLVRMLPHTRLVADETFSELDLDDDLTPRRPLAAFGKDVVSVGSLSKLVWGGLRLGWVRADEDVVARLGLTRSAADIAAPVLDQLLGIEVLAHLDAIRAERVTQLRARRDHLLGLVEAAGWSAVRPRGGMVLWVDLGDGASSTRLAAAARAYGVRVVPGPRFAVAGTHDRYLRLPFAKAEPVLTAALDRLRRAAADPQQPTADPPRWTA
ncbi:PLP-dependent aminotransferase family protein [uncultured Jatrophihabitans sp.]|uniref:aminotransferase-like domain-containing protein n=1 Tax=uncultured Jatrophihabitans sp. TaxID=1610747 RepID=UPI0035CA6F4E